MSITPAVKEALIEALAEAHDLKAPFYRDGGKMFMRFDRIDINFNGASAVVGFYCGSERLYEMQLAEIPPNGSITLSGMTGQMEVRLM